MSPKTYAAAVAAITLLGAAGVAHATPVEDEFVRICVASKTASEATVRARAEGYVTLPPPLRAAILKSFKRFPDDGEMLWRASEGEMSIFMAVSLEREGAPVRSRLVGGEACVVASAPSQPSLQLKLERLLNVGPAQSFGNDSAYIFELTGAGPVRLEGSDKGLMSAKVIRGSVRAATAIERPDMSGLVLMIPVIAER